MFLIFLFVACQSEENVVLIADTAPVRQLSVLQLKNTISDLFPNIELDLRHISIDTMDGFVSEAQLQFPPEADVLGFDNNIQGNGPTPIRIDTLQSVALAVSEQVITLSETIAACNGDKNCHLDYLQHLAKRAWRRPLTHSDIDELETLYQEANEDLSPEDTMDLCIQFILLSPDFIYFLEYGIPKNGEKDLSLSNHELATRLSYLIWNTMPDHNLRHLAEEELLEYPLIFENHVWVMLNDEKAHQGINHFHNQWMSTEEVNNAELDISVYFPDDEAEEEGALFFVNSILQHSMTKEMEIFAQEEVFNRSGLLSGFFISSKGYIPEALAPYYGIQIDTTQTPIDYLSAHLNEPEPIYSINLPIDQRRGFLTLLGSLHARSKPKYPSPVLRGLYVKERLLCMPVSQPPGDIPSIESIDNEQQQESNRDRYESISENESCAQCHDSIHGIGFTFENYDSIGEYQTHENDVLINSSGELIGTDVDGPVKNAVELSIELSQSKLVHDCYTTNWFRYTFGRQESSIDNAYLNALQQQFWTENGDIKQLLVNISTSYTFTHITKEQ